MMQFTPQMTLLLSVDPADFRKGIDALVALCQQQLDQCFFSVTVFAFTHRRRTAVKLLAYYGNGFWLFLKRFSQGKLKWWPSSKNAESICHIDATQLTILISQGNPINSSLGEPWKKLSTQPDLSSSLSLSHFG